MNDGTLGWIAILRLGLVQTALGAIVVLTTSTLNRIMVVELAFPAMLPGALVMIHYGMQVLRPRWGYGSDVGGRRTPWILGGMAVLAAGGVTAAVATAWMSTDAAAGIALAVIAFVLIGIGVGAAGTALLVLLATRVAPRRRAAAATIVWVMMIAGFVITATLAGHFLDPYSPARLVAVTAVTAAAALILAAAALGRIEWRLPPRTLEDEPQASRAAFREAFAQVWHEGTARRFALFVFVSMLAYSAQDLILEPFAGAVFGLTPGQSTQLSGLQNAGVLVGMVLVAVAVSGIGGRWGGSLKAWTVGGCLASAAAFAALVAASIVGPAWPLSATVFALGFANGAFAVAAIGSMMGLAGAGREAREGVRMGLWGAAQALAFGLGGFLGTAAVDLARSLLGAPAAAYGTVFAAEGVLFLAAAVLALRIDRPARQAVRATAPVASRYAAEPG